LTETIQQNPPGSPWFFWHGVPPCDLFRLPQLVMRVDIQESQPVRVVGKDFIGCQITDIYLATSYRRGAGGSKQPERRFTPDAWNGPRSI
jgi:hypothetical protein